MIETIVEVPDSDVVFTDREFIENNKDCFVEAKRIADVYPEGLSEPLVPDTFSVDDFGQGHHYECLMPTVLSTLIRYPEYIQNAFVTKKVRRDGRYTFRFFKNNTWVPVVIDDRIPMAYNEVLFTRSPTSRWWPLLLEKAYAKFYKTYDHVDGCNVVEVYYDLTGHPSLNVPMDVKLAKAAGAEITEGTYWLHVGRRIASGEFIAACLTGSDLESMGIQSDQQYGVLDVFSRTGTSSFEDVVVHLYNPYEDDEYLYSGPLSAKDTLWTPAQRTKHNVENPRSIFLPLPLFVKSMNSLQLCYMSTLNEKASFAFHAAWKGTTAGGNPTLSSWRHNPLFSVHNPTGHSVDVVISIVQPDQRGTSATDDTPPEYLQCGIVVVRYSYGKPIPSFFVTGNNHKTVHRSLFLNSREVSDMVTIPANSLCYVVPCCMRKESEGDFLLRVTALKGADASEVSIERVQLPHLNFDDAIVKRLLLHEHERERVDFYVEDETDVHVLLRQEKPFVGAQSGDAVAQDFLGIYLYDDVNRKIGGVHAATNNRETSILQHLTRPGRFALCITCPRAKGEVPVTVTIVTEKKIKAEAVHAPETAYVFHEDDVIDEGHPENVLHPIDYVPAQRVAPTFSMVADSGKLFLDEYFVEDNEMVTPEKWVRIVDLYPEGAKEPLVPQKWSLDDFEYGLQREYGLLSVFASLVGRHGDVLRHCFVTQQPRRDGRYTFQFFGYGGWEQVVIDDRIPVQEGQTVYCSSPTRRWWPLLLEKAYAKFYTLYTNMKTCTALETLYDLSGQPCLDTPLFAPFAAQHHCDIADPSFWAALRAQLGSVAVTATAQDAPSVKDGIQPGQTYGVLDLVMKPNAALEDIVVQLYNPDLTHPYTGPLSDSDAGGQGRHGIAALKKEWKSRHVCFLPLTVFCNRFKSFQRLQSTKLLPTPCQNFWSEWGDKTNGGNPTLISWRENPLYMIRNPTSEAVALYACVAQKDQRHRIHTLPDYSVNYICCGLSLVQSNHNVPTYLVTLNNHHVVAQGLYQNTRETANRMVVPPQSLCYLVPSAMLQEKSPFLLSYWFETEALLQEVQVERVIVDVARDLPALAFIQLRHRMKERVDFVVDTPTTVHILLRQEKPFKMDCGGDIMAEDYLALYLYDDQDALLASTDGASNYREIGLVHHLPNAGRYALSITCPLGTDTVPCRIEAVAVKDAHIRIAEAPEAAEDLQEADVQSFKQPEHLELVRAMDDTLCLQQREMQKSPAPTSVAQSLDKAFRVNDDPARQASGTFLQLSTTTLTPTPPPSELEPEAEKNTLEEERPLPGKAPSPPMVEAAVPEEGTLQLFGDAENFRESILPRYINGIPQKTLRLEDDIPFADMELACMEAAKEGHTARQKDLEEALQKRALDVANAFRDEVREALGAKAGFDITALPLDNHSGYLELEGELMKLLGNPEMNAAAITRTQQKMADVAVGMLMADVQPLVTEVLGSVPEDLLRGDAEFMELAARRAKLVKDGTAVDPDVNHKLRQLEKAMRKRAEQLAEQRKKALDGATAGKEAEQEAERHTFMRPIPGVHLPDLPLDTDNQFQVLEAERARLLSLPGDHSSDIQAVEEDLNRRAFELAVEQGLLPPDASFPLAVDREATRRRRCRLRPIPGVRMSDLPLTTDAQFLDLETERERLLALPGDHSTELKAVEEALNRQAFELAKERGLVPKDAVYQANTTPEEARQYAYLRCIPGIDPNALQLSEDAAFRELDAERARLLAPEGDHGAEIKAVEEALNGRAFQIAKEMGMLAPSEPYYSAEQRALARAEYLLPIPGVDLSDLPLDQDEHFQLLENERARLFSLPGDHANDIRALDDALNRRAWELAQELGLLPEDAVYIARTDLPTRRRRRRPVKDTYGGDSGYLYEDIPDPLTLMDQLPCGVSLAHLKDYFTADAEFQHLVDLYYNAITEDETKDMIDVMNRRAGELAGAVHDVERADFPATVDGVLVNTLDLNSDPVLTGLEGRARELRMHPEMANAKQLEELEAQIVERVRELAKLSRDPYISEETVGVPLELLDLANFPSFLAKERELRRLLRNPKANKDSIAYLEELLNEKAKERARSILDAQRNYLGSAVDGIDLAELPLVQDPDFCRDEAKRALLLAQNPTLNAEEIAEIEERLRRRARRQARQRKAKDLAGVVCPEDVPLELINPHSDPVFNSFATTLAALRQNPNADARTITDIEAKMNERVAELARKILRGERELYVPEEVDGVPTSLLPLDSDQAFKDLERERMRVVAAMEAVSEARERRRRGARNAGGADWDAVDDDDDDEGERPLDVHWGHPHGHYKAGRNRQLHPFAQEDRADRAEPVESNEDEERPLSARAKNGRPRRYSQNRAMAPPMWGEETANKRRAKDEGEDSNNDEERPLFARTSRDRPRRFSQNRAMAPPMWGEETPNKRRAKDEGEDSNNDEERPLSACASRDRPRRYSQNRAMMTPMSGEETANTHRTTDTEESPMFSSLRKSTPQRRVGPLGKNGDSLKRDSFEQVENGMADDRDDAPLAPGAVRKSWSRRAGKPNGSRDASATESDADGESPADEDEQLNMEFLRAAYARHVGAVESDGGADQHEEQLLAALDRLLGERVKVLAHDRIEAELALVDPEPLGVPVASLRPHEDETFTSYITEYRHLQAEDSAEKEQQLQALERLLNDRVYELAQAELDETPAAKTTCATPNVSSIPVVNPSFAPIESEPQPSPPNRRSLPSLPTPLQPRQLLQKPSDPLREVSPVKPIVACVLPELSSRSGSEIGKKQRRVHEVKDKVIKRVIETIENEVPLYEDPEFPRKVSADVEGWPHLYEVYPSGYNQPILPEDANGSDVAASLHQLSFLGPFLAALSRVPPLLKRIFQTTAHPGIKPYVFNFFNPDSRPVAVKIDDRMPCNTQREPLFAYSPTHAWWPLLAEKAYAKYLGGYDAFGQCTSNETLRDLTGRPVTHLPLTSELATKIVGGDYMSPVFWERVRSNLDAGDVYMAASAALCPDGFQPEALFAVFDVVTLVPGSKRLEDIIIKVHNCYREGPQYSGPLHAHDPEWNDPLRRVCGVMADDGGCFTYTPLRTFLRNFVSLLHCHINSGDRRTLSGGWDADTAGGGLERTTFRRNPAYALENRDSQPVEVLIELRHEGSPASADATYPSTALAHLRSKVHVACPLVTLNQFDVLQKGLFCDAREVAWIVELPARSTSMIIPYTSKPNMHGKFKLSIYPQKHKVDLRAVMPVEQTHSAARSVVVVPPAGSRGATVDFAVTAPCDVHVLLRQEKHAHHRGKPRDDASAEDGLTVAVYEDSTQLVATTSGEGRRAREMGVSFQAPRAGCYTIVVSASHAIAPRPCVLTVFTPAPSRFLSAPQEPNRVPPVRRWSVPNAGAVTLPSVVSVNNNYTAARPTRPQPRPEDQKPFHRYRRNSL